MKLQIGGINEKSYSTTVTCWLHHGSCISQTLAGVSLWEFCNSEMKADKELQVLLIFDMKLNQRIHLAGVDIQLGKLVAEESM